jgi:hypothetical protein
MSRLQQHVLAAAPLLEVVAVGWGCVMANVVAVAVCDGVCVMDKPCREACNNRLRCRPQEGMAGRHRQQPLVGRCLHGHKILQQRKKKNVASASCCTAASCAACCCCRCRSASSCYCSLRGRDAAVEMDDEFSLDDIMGDGEGSAGDAGAAAAGAAPPAAGADAAGAATSEL